MTMNACGRALCETDAKHRRIHHMQVILGPAYDSMLRLKEEEKGNTKFVTLPFFIISRFAAASDCIAVLGEITFSCGLIYGLVRAPFPNVISHPQERE